MANIKNSEIEFLKGLRDKLSRYKRFKEDCAELDALLVRQEEMIVKRNARTWKHIKEKRETDPTYGRAKADIKKYNVIREKPILLSMKCLIHGLGIRSDRYAET